MDFGRSRLKEWIVPLDRHLLKTFPTPEGILLLVLETMPVISDTKGVPPPDIAIYSGFSNGFADEFYRRLGKYCGTGQAVFFFERGITEKVCLDMLQEIRSSMWFRTS